MSLAEKHVAILVEDGYQELELHYPRLRLLEAGMRVSVVGEGCGGFQFPRGSGFHSLRKQERRSGQ